MKKLIYLVPILILVLAVIAAAYNKSAKNNTEQQTANQNGKGGIIIQGQSNKEAMPKDSQGEAHGAKLAGSRIDIQNKTSLKPGQVTLNFKLFGLDAHEFGPDDLKLAHEKLMHVMLVRNDMQFYEHLHPEFIEGKWTITTQIPQQGNYEMYVDIEPKEEKPAVLRLPLSIGGSTEEKIFPKVSENLTTVTDGISASLDKAELSKTGADIKLNFTLTKNSQIIGEIGNYLGAFGHVVVLKHGEPDHFVHAHPLDQTAPKNGIVGFESEFVSNGMYTVFAQFNVQGGVKTFPITMEVDNLSNPQIMKENNHMQ